MDLKYFIITFLLLEMISTTLSINYCNKELCFGKQHIACNNNNKYAAACSSNAKVIQLSAKVRQQIVTKHNRLRNKIASGFGKYQSAARMATMQWSPELAKLAALNVKQCVMKHDRCRNTAAFKYAGQNLALTSWTGDNRPVPMLVGEQIQSWFDEYKYASMSIIRKYKSKRNGKKIGHFTTMIQDKSTRVGCAILRQTARNGMQQQLMACNYAYTNVLGEPVYVVGNRGGQCKTGRSRNYKSLCSTRESYKFN